MDSARRPVARFLFGNGHVPPLLALHAGNLVKVHLIAYTATDERAMREAEPRFISSAQMAPDALGEFAGRGCYQSWDRPNPATRSNRDYLGNIIGQGHFSVLEHASASFYVQGVSRNLTHELVRHRHLSFSQLSQRFVDETRGEFVDHPTHRSAEHHGRITALADYVHHVTQEAYREAVHIYEREGRTRKEAREAARFLLSNDVETKFVVTGNFRAWRDVMGKRLSPHADREIQEFSSKVLAELTRIAPNSFQDMSDE